MTKKKPVELKDDPRVIAMMECMFFALNSFRNKPIWDNEKRSMETWHTWFKRVLTEAGYELSEPKQEKRDA